MKRLNYLKAGFTALMAIYGFVCARDVAVVRFLDRVDLVIHEAGHLLFSYFGESCMVLGGTIGQLFVPAAFTVYFAARRELYSGTVTLFWTGQNLFNISVYIRDAQTMALPLVTVGGGEDAIHDWNYILAKLGLLRWDHAIGTGVFILGLLVCAASVVAGFFFSLSSAAAEDGSPATRC